MSELAQRHCVPCHGGIPPLEPEKVRELLAELDGWEVIDGHHLHKAYTFPDFATALAFVNRLGAEAESEGHHPDIKLAWGRVEVFLWTHAIDGLSESDFILAARADTVLTS